MAGLLEPAGELGELEISQNAPWPAGSAGPSLADLVSCLKNLIPGGWPVVRNMVLRGHHIFPILSKEGPSEVRRSFQEGPRAATKLSSQANP